MLDVACCCALRARMCVYMCVVTRARFTRASPKLRSIDAAFTDARKLGNEGDRSENNGSICHSS